jgi:hypothetical protein
MSTQERCVICDHDADAGSALSVQSVSYEALSKWAGNTCAKVVSFFLDSFIF